MLKDRGHVPATKRLLGSIYPRLAKHQQIVKKPPPTCRGPAARGTLGRYRALAKSEPNEENKPALNTKLRMLRSTIRIRCGGRFCLLFGYRRFDVFEVAVNSLNGFLGFSTRFVGAVRLG